MSDYSTLSKGAIGALAILWERGVGVQGYQNRVTPKYGQTATVGQNEFHELRGHGLAYSPGVTTDTARFPLYALTETGRRVVCELLDARGDGS